MYLRNFIILFLYYISHTAQCGIVYIFKQYTIVQYNASNPLFVRLSVQEIYGVKKLKIFHIYQIVFVYYIKIVYKQKSFNENKSHKSGNTSKRTKVYQTHFIISQIVYHGFVFRTLKYYYYYNFVNFNYLYLNSQNNSLNNFYKIMF